MKDYKKIYERLKKELKDELKNCTDLYTEVYQEEKFIDCIEYKNNVAVLEWVISLLPELEGKEYKNMLFNVNDFERWQKKIGVKK